MIVVLILNIIVVALTFLESKNLFKHGLLLSFILIFIFLAIRVDYGNDYEMYYNLYRQLGKRYVDFHELKDYDDHFEIGWRYLNKIFSFLGLNFNAFLACISLANCVVFYTIIKRYVPQDYYWLAVFLYVFNPDYMLIHLSAIRQLLAILILLVTLPLLLSKKYVQFILLNLVSLLFHTSSMFIILLIPISLINWKYSKVNTVLIAVSYLLLFVLSASISGFMDSVVSVFFDRYSVYTDEKGEVTTGLGFFVVFIFLSFLLLAKKNMDQSSQLLTNISIFSLLISVIGINLMMVYRLNMYFIPLLVLTLPLMVKHTEDFFQKRFLILLIMFFYLYNFFIFFESEIYREYYIHYQTIFN